MTLLDYLTIVAFAAGVLLAGLAFSGRQSDIKSFFSAGGAIPWGISGLSLFMGFFSAGTFVVWGAIAYTHGLVAITIQATMCVAGFVVGVLIAPRWQKTGALTAAEYITERFGARTQKSYTCLFLLISLFTTGSFLYPIARIVQVSTGFPLEACILALGGFCILYVALGGLWSVVITDVLQFVVLTVAVLITVPLSFDRIGGVQALFDRAPEGFFSLTNGTYPWVFMVAFGIYNAVFIGGNWAYVQRYTSVRTPRDAKKVGYLFGALYMICPLLWMLPPMICRIYDGGLTGMEDEGAYLLMCREALPGGMLGMMLGGMIFATASSLNATLNISAGVFTNDIFRNLRPKSSERALMIVAKLSTLVFGLLAVFVALMVPKMGGIVNVVISVAALTGVPLYLPVVWSLFSKYQTRRSILSVTVSSLAVNALLKFVTPGFGLSLDRTWEMVVGVAVPALLLLGYEVYARLSGGGDVRYAAYEKVMTGRQTEKTDNMAGNSFGIKVIGIGTLTGGVMVTALGIVASHDGLLIAGYGAALLLVGGVLLKRSKTSKKA